MRMLVAVSDARKGGILRKSPVECVKEKLEERGLYECALEIARANYVSFDMMVGPGRQKSFCTARRKLYQALTSKGLSNCEVADILGRDPVTVLQGVRNAP